MTTYQLQIDENVPLGRSIITLLRSAPNVVSLRKSSAKITIKEEDTELYKSLDRAFKDVKLMIDGKKREKTVEEFLAELPDEL